MAYDPFAVARHRAAQNNGVLDTLETLFTSADGFGLTTASPLQRAICRVLDGLPIGDLWDDKHVSAAFGGQRWTGGTPHEMVLLSGIRSGKSLLVAARALQVTQTCQVSHLVTGEVPRVSVVSVSKDLAQVIFGYITGHLRAKPALSRLLIGDPTADSVFVRHPSGRPVEIRVTAGSRAGASLVARWSAGVIFDEAPRMLGQEDGVINLDDARSAVLGRLLPGASILYPGSPWAPFGPVYRMATEHHGRANAPVCVVRAPAYAMNPIYWTPERCAALQASDPDVYLTDVEAEFADRTSALVPREVIELCARKYAGQTMVPRVKDQNYMAAIDPATRGNAWTLGIATKDPTGTLTLVRARQWQGSTREPLRPGYVLDEIREELRAYGIDSAWTDQWSYDAIKETASERGVNLHDVVSQPQVWFGLLRSMLLEGTIQLCGERAVAEDLSRIQRKVTQTGVSYVLPKTPDGRHCDYAAMLALLVSRPCKAPAFEVESKWDHEHHRMREQAFAEVRRRAGGDDDL